MSDVLGASISHAYAVAPGWHDFELSTGFDLEL